MSRVRWEESVSAAGRRVYSAGTSLAALSPLMSLLQLVLISVILAALGCQQQMAVQPSYKPLQPATFFDDERSARPLVPGTIARGHLRIDAALFTGRRPGAGSGFTAREGPATVPAPPSPGSEGRVLPPLPERQAAPGGFEEDDYFVREFPIPVNRSVLRHGYHRYMIYCVVCHDPLGTGRGKIVERGFTAPPSFHIERLREAPVGRLFAVASEGYGSMPAYAAQIPPEDRWAIVAYIRALQLSQHFPADELTPEMRKELASADLGLPPGAELILEPREEVR